MYTYIHIHINIGFEVECMGLGLDRVEGFPHARGHKLPCPLQIANCVRVQGAGFRVQGSGCRVHVGSGFRVHIGDPSGFWGRASG